MPDAEYVFIRRENVKALLRLIDDRWTPAEDVLKRIRETLWSAQRGSDYGLWPDEIAHWQREIERAEERLALEAEAERDGNPDADV